LHVIAPFWLRNSGWCPATDPIEDIAWLKPASPDAEPREIEQTPQVRAAHDLLVAADELCDLERREQTVRQLAERRRRQRLAMHLRIGIMRRLGRRLALHTNLPSISDQEPTVVTLIWRALSVAPRG